MAEIERRYEEAIARHGQQRLERIPPAYDFFDNGEKIPAEARKIYRTDADLQRRFGDPYAAGDGPCFMDWLREHRPKLLSGLRLPEGRLERAFDDIFDETYYLERYPDAKAAIEQGRYESAIAHYIDEGSALLFDPNEFFVTRYYIEQAKYLDGFRRRSLPRSKRSTVLWHYLEVGLSNAKEPIEFFDSQFYLSRYDDIERAVRVGLISSPLAHFIAFGSAENRKPGPDFDPFVVLERDPSLSEEIEKHGLRGVFGAIVATGRILGRVMAP